MSATLLLSLLPLLLLGGALGFLGGLFGIGGGIIAIPLLVTVYGMDQAMAQGTALVMMVPNLLAAWWRYMRRNPVDLGGAVRLALVGTATTYGAAQLAQGLDQHVLRLLFSAFLAVLAVGMFRRRPEAGPATPVRSGLMPLVGLAGGGSMGLLGVGGGLVATPLLSRWFGLDQRVAQSLALALVLPCSAAALASYARAGNVDWTIGGVLGVGGLACVSAGVALAHAFPEKVMRHLFAGLLIATALAMLAV
ncbi:sulfite exporter TauE/SafE [Paramagnetospirillum caucaseum]|uniref:Probable membrane transporter protein n=1 Tax=Paramagnetospirillum caucaseum TaxID=1244869 RepID=M3A7I8_9PROT|nr:sulfite exporter TauE/SafE family protein [Paramagnetospirillum caucaseum]EME68748.1 sulfite exporter TauE/SafE [Paramagnetospirillum caucaseum]